jgi:hypothetical protein
VQTSGFSDATWASNLDRDPNFLYGSMDRVGAPFIFPPCSICCRQWLPFASAAARRSQYIYFFEQVKAVVPPVSYRTKECTYVQDYKGKTKKRKIETHKGTRVCDTDRDLKVPVRVLFSVILQDPKLRRRAARLIYESSALALITSRRQRSVRMQKRGALR